MTLCVSHDDDMTCHSCMGAQYLNSRIFSKAKHHIDIQSIVLFKKKVHDIHTPSKFFCFWVICSKRYLFARRLCACSKTMAFTRKWHLVLRHCVVCPNFGHLALTSSFTKDTFFQVKKVF